LQIVLTKQQSAARGCLKNNNFSAMSFYCVTNVNDCLAEMFFKKLLIKAEI